MKDIKRILASLVMVAVILSAGFTTASCSDDDEKTVFVPGTPLGITEYSVPGTMYIIVDDPLVSIAGLGFEKGDKVKFKSLSDGKEFTFTDISFYEQYIEFKAPIGDFRNDDSFLVTVERDGKTQELGTTTVSYRVSQVVPEKEGFNIRGVVSSGVNRLEGVRVTDGYEIALTDENGFYYLNSDKVHGYVFMTIPSGYFPESDGALPRFWYTLESQNTAVSEQHNFYLDEVDNEDHLMIFTADLHLANRASNNDLASYASFLIEDIKNFASGHQDKPIYNICLGDMSWDTYWINENYDITDYINLARQYPLPLFHVMGNHDNDPEEEGDFNCAKKYKLHAGPTYYSMDLGGVHYVVLDNIIYNKKTSSSEVDNESEYWRDITTEQLTWLKKDLSYVTDTKTPIVVCMHSQTYKVEGTTADGKTRTIKEHYNGSAQGAVGAPALAAAFAGYDKVTYLSGHAHINRPVTRGEVPSYPNIQELNIGAACGTWWWTAVYNPVIYCTDGSPGGYMVFDNQGQDFRWYYKSFRHTSDYQFRVMDMNNVRKFYTNTSEGVYFNENVQINTPAAEPYDVSPFEVNSILVNIFNWDTNWNVTVEEKVDGEWIDLNYTFRGTRDPLHNLTYDVNRFYGTDNNTISAGFRTGTNYHTLYTVASAADTPVRVTATDPFGYTYSQTVERPKAFNADMF